MAVSLSKGGRVSLAKEDPSLVKALTGLGWTARSTDGAPFDLDASAILVGPHGKVYSDADFCFYNRVSVYDGAVVYHGDNRTGSGDGDDEKISIEFSKIPSNIEKIIITVTIDAAEERRQNFGQVQDAYVRVVNEDTNREILRFDLSEDMSTETAMIFGEFYRKNGGWSFNAVGQGYSGGLKALAESFGIEVE